MNEHNGWLLDKEHVKSELVRQSATLEQALREIVSIKIQFAEFRAENRVSNKKNAALWGFLGAIIIKIVDALMKYGT